MAVVAPGGNQRSQGDSGQRGADHQLHAYRLGQAGGGKGKHQRRNQHQPTADAEQPGQQAGDTPHQQIKQPGFQNQSALKNIVIRHTV